MGPVALHRFASFGTDLASAARGGQDELAAGRGRAIVRRVERAGQDLLVGVRLGAERRHGQLHGPLSTCNNKT